jgi:hypothetical protein
LATAVEHLSEEVTKSTHVAGVKTEIACASSTCHWAKSTNFVVLRSPCFVTKHVIRSADRLEPIFGGSVPRVFVRVEFAGKFSVRPCDLFRCRFWTNSQH